MWHRAASWGHWPAWVLRGRNVGQAVQDQALSTKGMNRLWILSFWKVVLTLGLWEKLVLILQDLLLSGPSYPKIVGSILRIPLLHGLIALEIKPSFTVSAGASFG